jgi:hypothetical protein
VRARHDDHAACRYYHTFIEGSTRTSLTNLDSAGNAKIPTDYGLGKRRVLQNLAMFRIINIATQQVNTTRTDEIQAPYLTSPDTRREGWPKWAQHFCNPACHRDALVQQYEVRPADYAGKPAFAFLSRPGSSATPGQPNPLIIIRCVACPPFQAAYTVGAIVLTPDNPGDNGTSYTAAFDGTRLGDPRNIYISGACYPWFGSVPLLAPYIGAYAGGTYNFANSTVVYHGQALDGVLDPPHHKEFTGTVCPINTYNDRCAHYHLYTARATLIAPTSNTMTMSPAMQPRCLPCPPGGYHTAGKTGAWFCLPPLGRTALIVSGATASPLRGLLKLFVGSSNNVSTLWARRDILGYEWECGTQPEHCYQCDTVPGMKGKLPHEFNQAMILDHLLVWQDCPSRFYCPTALEAPPMACPAAFPWSPRGSSSLQNCTCERGTFRHDGAGGCVPCPLPGETCSTGQYLAGTTLCTQNDGATSGGECAPCTNAPAGATYVGGVGVEVLLLLVGGNASLSHYYSYRGACAFDCPRATSISGENTCLATYRCTPVPQMRLQDQRLIYSGGLVSPHVLQDGFRIAPYCRMDRPLGLRLDSVATMTTLETGWLLASTTCADATPDTCGAKGAICSVVANATYFSNAQCALCPPAPVNGFYDTESMRGALAVGCGARCNTGFYFNASDRLCGSCAELDRSLCANTTRSGDNTASSLHVQGGGCYGDDTPFRSLTDLAYLRTQNCILCDKSLPPDTSQQYLDTADASGCAYKPCSATADVALGRAYVVSACSGTSNYVTALCTTACSDGFYLKGACTPTATGICTPCTELNPGYHRISLCDATVDSVWQACGVPAAGGVFVPGHYCPGDGRMLVCPNNMTSLVHARDAGSHCFCPAGTRPLPQPPGINTDPSCEPMRCPNTTSSDNGAPGGGWRSPYYMTIETATFNSVCRACSPPTLPNEQSPAFTLGDGIEVAACRCPPGHYIVPVAPSGAAADDGDDDGSGAGGGGVACQPCPAASLVGGALSADSRDACAISGGHYATVPDTCWSGRQTGAPACRCVMPPFSSVSGAAVCGAIPSMCAPGFLVASDLLPDGGPTPSEPSTGSPLYIARTQSALGWSRLFASPPPDGSFFEDYSIARLVTTSDFADWGDVSNLQYALWTIADQASTNVYAVPLPPNMLVYYNPYGSTGMWTVVSAGSEESYCTVEDIAVAQWTVPQTPGRLHPAASGGGSSYSVATDAAAVVMDHTLYTAGTSLWLYLNTFAVGSNGAIAWGSAVTVRNRIAIASLYVDITPVAMAHAYLAPVSAAYSPDDAQQQTMRDSSTFFVAYTVPRLPASGRYLETAEIAAVSVRGGDGVRVATLPVMMPPGPQSAVGQTISAMAVLPFTEGGGVYLYLSLSTAQHVQLFKWAMPPGGPTTTLLPAGVDELFLLSSSGPPWPRVHSLSILWPTVMLTPIFVALVGDPATDVASAQPILRRRNGPPCSVYAADFVQRTFVPLQGMPSPTHPAAVAITGTDIGKALWVGTDDTASGVVYGLPTERCGTNYDATNGDSLRYWDGTRCLSHACVRARSCTTGQGQVWNARLLRCTCTAGYYLGAESTDANLICLTCPASYICDGNGTRVACPSNMVGPARATSSSDCFCRDGEYFTGTKCATCPQGFWCPNRWDARLCPGSVDPTRSLAGSMYPVGCTCSEGKVGALCPDCPNGFYCAANPVLKVVNSAVRLSLAYTTVDAPEFRDYIEAQLMIGAGEGLSNHQYYASVEERWVCSALTTLLAAYFQTSSLWYLRDPTICKQRVYCAFLAAPDGRTSIRPVALLMVQTEPSDATNSIVLGLPEVLNLQKNATAATGRFVITEVQPSNDPVYAAVGNNTALLCPLGKTPSPGLTGCVCAPGYELQGVLCKACPTGQYKPASGVGACLICPLGTTSPVGSPACLGGQGPGANGTGAGGDGSATTATNIPLIAGGVAGGVFVSCCLIYAITRVMSFGA